MPGFAQIGNLLEAALWFAMALVLVLKRRRAKEELRAVFRFLAWAFLVFGITDLVESRTGVWWSPPWLLVLKGACVVALVIGFRRYYQIVRRGTGD